MFDLTKMKDIVPVITKEARKYQHVIMNNLPKVLACGALGCLGGAVITTAIGMHKADQIISDEVARREETLPEYNNKELTVSDKVGLTWKEFVPAALFTTAAGMLIIASERKGTERYLALMSACTLGQQALEEHKQAEVDILGPEKASEIETRVRQNMARNAIADDGVQVVSGPGAKTLYVEPYSNTPFWATYEDIMHAFNYVNHIKQDKGVASINDFLEALDLRTMLVAADWGWNEDDPLVEPDLDRSTLVDEDPTRPATLIGYSIEPKQDFGNDRRQY